MDIDPEELWREIYSLCQREGARGPRMREHRPQLERVCGITERDKPSERARKVECTIERDLDEPEHLEEKELLLFALGLHPLAQQSTLERRLDALARRRHVATRTLLRRRPGAISLFVSAAVAATRASVAPDDVGYETDVFDATMTFQGETVTVSQRRKVIPVRSGVDTVRCLHRIPKSPAGEEYPVTVRLPDGSTCQPRHRRRGTVSGYFIDLRRPLEVGLVYEFDAVFELPVRTLDPCFIVLPDAPFRGASVTVQFSPSGTPRRAWRVDHALQGEFTPCPEDAEFLRLDPSARLHADFQALEKGRCYGIAWDWR